MRPRSHWTQLVGMLALTWCAAVLVSHFWVPESWARSLGVGLFELPLWVGVGYFAHRRAKRRARVGPGGSAA